MLVGGIAVVGAGVLAESRWRAQRAAEADGWAACEPADDYEEFGNGNSL